MLDCLGIVDTPRRGLRRQRRRGRGGGGSAGEGPGRELPANAGSSAPQTGRSLEAPAILHRTTGVLLPRRWRRWRRWRRPRAARGSARRGAPLRCMPCAGGGAVHLCMSSTARAGPTDSCPGAKVLPLHRRGGARVDRQDWFACAVQDPVAQLEGEARTVLRLPGPNTCSAEPGVRRCAQRNGGPDGRGGTRGGPRSRRRRCPAPRPPGRRLTWKQGHDSTGCAHCLHARPCELPVKAGKPGRVRVAALEAAPDALARRCRGATWRTREPAPAWGKPPPAEQAQSAPHGKEQRLVTRWQSRRGGGECTL